MESKIRILSVQRVRTQKRTVKQQGLLIEAELREAIPNSQLYVHFQPQFDLESGRGLGVEALARWFHPRGQSISPSIFIPIAERSGLIRDLGASILRQACEVVSSWTLSTPWRPTLSVNVSARQIDDEFSDVVRRILQCTGFTGNRLELELTETALITNTERAIDCLAQCKELGVRVAVDDFGIGCSGLSYVSRLPIDRLKLDKSFIHRMTFERKTAAIVRSVIALGRDTGITVLAEGIETQRQVEMLQTFGCEQVQGYLFGKPVSSQDAQALLMTPWGDRFGCVSRRDFEVNRGLHAA